jgi:hypothetical protein
MIQEIPAHPAILTMPCRSTMNFLYTCHSRKMTLHGELLSGGTLATLFDVLEPPGVADIVVGFFDIRNGPQILAISSDIIPANVLIDYLFPSRWEHHTIFAFEVGGFFGLATGAMADHIITDRGNLQVTVAILSRSPTVDIAHWRFLSASHELIAALPALEFPPFLEAARQCSLFDESRQIIDQPLYPYFADGTVSRHFLHRPADFMAVWRARVTGLTITVEHTKQLKELTSVCAFVGAVGRPICDFRDCVHHLDLPQTDKYQNALWKVCCVTHPMLQAQPIAAVALMDDSLFTGRSVQWVNRGGGPIVDRLLQIARGGNDRQILDTFVELNRQILRLAGTGRELSKEEVRAIGLDPNNAAFLAEFFRTRGSRTSVEKLYSLC